MQKHAFIGVASGVKMTCSTGLWTSSVSPTTISGINFCECNSGYFLSNQHRSRTVSSRDVSTCCLCHTLGLKKSAADDGRSLSFYVNREVYEQRARLNPIYNKKSCGSLCHWHMQRKHPSLSSTASPTLFSLNRFEKSINMHTSKHPILTFDLLCVGLVLVQSVCFP